MVDACAIRLGSFVAKRPLKTRTTIILKCFHCCRKNIKLESILFNNICESVAVAQAEPVQRPILLICTNVRVIVYDVCGWCGFLVLEIDYFIFIFRFQLFVVVVVWFFMCLWLSLAHRPPLFFSSSHSMCMLK